MTRAVINFATQLVTFSWLTGPIFAKELRVSSRRRRNYVLRFVYLAALTIFLVLIWLEQVKYSGSGLRRVSRMAEAGKLIIAVIVWVQFIAIQLVAIIMLSNSISDEIYHRTLGVLMTTPVNSFQIVMGKLFSKLLQLVLLLAITLPLLAIVRVFGGVPWDYVVSSLCVTLSTALFFGSLSLFFSIFTRRAYAVIIITILTLAFLFALLPFLVAIFWNAVTGDWPDNKLTEIMFYPNPYVVQFFDTAVMQNPRGGGWMGFLWSVHCGIILAASAFVLLLSTVLVRKTALRQATGQLGPRRRRRRSRSKNAVGAELDRQSSGRVRRINGSPTVWKELRTPLFRRHKVLAYISIFIVLALLFVTYWFFEDENHLDEDEVQMMYVAIFMGIGMLFTIILPATCITAEKEARSWPLLLATPLSDAHILLGKFAGILRRCLPAWLLLFGHLLLFAAVGYIHPIAIAQIAIVVAWVVVFLGCTGLYFSARFRRSTTAVIMNFALAGVIWALAPFLLLLVCEVANFGQELTKIYTDTNPFVHALVVIDGTTNTSRPYVYDWSNFERLNIIEATCWMVFCMLCYVIVGFFFAWRAKCLLRRRIF